MAEPGMLAGALNLARRRYVTRVTQQRIHQARFRARVLLAYSVRCTICRLHDHPELLDAAHILSVSLRMGASKPSSVSLVITRIRQLEGKA